MVETRLKEVGSKSRGTSQESTAEVQVRGHRRLDRGGNSGELRGGWILHVY